MKSRNCLRMRAVAPQMLWCLILISLDDSFSAHLDDLFFSKAIRIEQGSEGHFDQFGNLDRDSA